MCKMNTDPLIPYFPFFAIGLFCVCFVWMILELHIQYIDDFFGILCTRASQLLCGCSTESALNRNLSLRKSLFNVCACLRACVYASWQHTHIHSIHNTHRPKGSTNFICAPRIVCRLCAICDTTSACILHSGFANYYTVFITLFN